MDRINNELRANAKAYNRDYSNKRNLNTTDYFRKLTDENVRALKDTMKMFEGLTKESINKLSDNNFNSILTNGITKRLQEFSKESKNEYDFTKTVNEFFKNISPLHHALCAAAGVSALSAAGSWTEELERSCRDCSYIFKECVIAY